MTQADACQEIPAQDRGKYASIWRAKLSGGLCAALSTICVVHDVFSRYRERGFSKPCRVRRYGEFIPNKSIPNSGGNTDNVRPEP